MAEVELRIPAESAYVGVVRLAIAALARTAGLDEDAVEDLNIAVSEACANAVMSNRSDASGEPVVVGFQHAGEDVVVEVCDRGAAYGRNGEPAPQTQVAPDRFDMSMALLSSLVDECHLEERDEGGTRVRLRLSGRTSSVRA